MSDLRIKTLTRQHLKAVVQRAKQNSHYATYNGILKRNFCNKNNAQIRQENEKLTTLFVVERVAAINVYLQLEGMLKKKTYIHKYILTLLVLLLLRLHTYNCKRQPYLYSKSECIYV